MRHRDDDEDARDWAKGQPADITDLRDDKPAPLRPLKAPLMRTDSPAFAALFERLKGTNAPR